MNSDMQEQEEARMEGIPKKVVAVMTFSGT